MEHEVLPFKNRPYRDDYQAMTNKAEWRIAYNVDKLQQQRFEQRMATLWKFIVVIFITAAVSYTLGFRHGHGF